MPPLRIEICVNVLIFVMIYDIIKLDNIASVITVSVIMWCR